MSGNGGKCKPGFQKGLLDDVTRTAPHMNIKIDDIKSAVNKSKREEAEATMAQQDAPTIPSTTTISMTDPIATNRSYAAINPTMIIPSSISNLTTHHCCSFFCSSHSYHLTGYFSTRVQSSRKHSSDSLRKHLAPVQPLIL